MIARLHVVKKRKVVLRSCDVREQPAGSGVQVGDIKEA
jgi:hypothetical protein